tara:strand:- start:991 stop:1458 length:468 start_codon:yes stop_codon:yes gene_type:complete
MKKVKSMLSVFILSAIVLFSCSKEEIIESNSSSSNEISSSAKISDPYELLKKGDNVLYQKLETSRGGNYVNFVGGIIKEECVAVGAATPMCCYSGSLCYIIVEADVENMKNDENTHIMMYEKSNGEIERFKGNVSKLEIVDNQIISGEFNINEEY